MELHISRYESKPWRNDKVALDSSSETTSIRCESNIAYIYAVPLLDGNSCLIFICVRLSIISPSHKLKESQESHILQKQRENLSLGESTLLLVSANWKRKQIIFQLTIACNHLVNEKKKRQIHSTCISNEMEFSLLNITRWSHSSLMSTLVSRPRK